ncbi:MAG: RDD family protein [Actinobacteria bacterium]|nr:RDD family protein [Actinomycetota bacterium]
MARTIGSWLSGSGAFEPDEASGSPDHATTTYPGQRLGLPDTGRRSIARMGRRVSALFVDWLIAYGLAALVMTTTGLVSATTLSTAVLVIWIIIGAVSVRLFGFTPGQLALGLVVVPTDGGEQVGIGRALARGLLIALVIPALITDTDLRGLHDRVTRTAVIRR